jgi:RNA polymerase sigma-70 factor (ECF subfamily)
MKLRTRVRSRELSEDICQETFLRVFTVLRRKGGLQHPERLGAFVNTVSNNVMLELFRSNGRTDPFPAEGYDTPDHHASAESELVLDERRNIVKRVLGELPVRYRELLRMIFWEEKDKSEVCRQFNVDREYLRVVLHRAKLSFKASVGGSRLAVS